MAMAISMNMACCMRPLLRMGVPLLLWQLPQHTTISCCCCCCVQASWLRLVLLLLLLGPLLLLVIVVGPVEPAVCCLAVAATLALWGAATSLQQTRQDNAIQHKGKGKAAHGTAVSAWQGHSTAKPLRVYFLTAARIFGMMPHN